MNDLKNFARTHTQAHTHTHTNTHTHTHTHTHARTYLVLQLPLGVLCESSGFLCFTLQLLAALFGEASLLDGLQQA
jgi:hypothetical protein